MFEFTVQKEDKPRKLADNEAEKTAQKVGSLWKTWDDARSKQKNIADKLRPEIYLDEREKANAEDEEKWKSDVHLNKIYALGQTQQAFIWDNIYSNVENLFDVEGADQNSSETAPAQKANLVNIFSRIGIQRKLDEAIEYWRATGELCLFVSWQTRYKQVRRPLMSMPDVSNLLYTTANFGIFNQVVYNGANVDAINPLDLVFDPHISPEDSEKWDSCGKIIKTWETYDKIANNKLYKLSKAQLEEIRKSLTDHKEEEDRAASQKVDDVIDENRIEVLQYWGDWTLSNGEVLHNWYIVSIGRQYLAAFEYNRWVVNPIINCATLRDVKNKRGIPELWSIYDLAKEQERKVNLQNDAQALNLNSPAYAPEGFFKENSIKLFPGKIITYKANLEDPNSIIKMQFPLMSNEQIIEYYDGTASSVSGIFPNMQGQDEAKDATATEINVKVQGQTTRLSKILDTIKQNAIVPMVTKVADLVANMEIGDKTIFIDSDGQRISEVIGDNVRQGSYEYKYTDNSGIQKKLSQNQTLTAILTPVWNDPAVILNKPEIIKEALNNAGIENADKYIIGENPQMSMNGVAPAPMAQTPQPADMGIANEELI